MGSSQVRRGKYCPVRDKINQGGTFFYLYLHTGRFYAKRHIINPEIKFIISRLADFPFFNHSIFLLFNNKLINYPLYYTKIIVTGIVYKKYSDMIDNSFLKVCKWKGNPKAYTRYTPSILQAYSKYTLTLLFIKCRTLFNIIPCYFFV
jgi:hypothetical protein